MAELNNSQARGNTTCQKLQYWNLLQSLGNNAKQWKDQINTDDDDHDYERYNRSLTIVWDGNEPLAKVDHNDK